MNLPLPATKSAPGSDEPNQLGAGNEVILTRLPLLFQICLGVSLSIVPCSGALSQQVSNDSSASAAAIVGQLVAHNEARERELGPYTAHRHYHVAYHGFPHGAEADMVVDVTCDGPSSKKFEIVSQSGSHLLVDHVLKKLLETEQDASHDRTDNALTPANYNFTLVRTEAVEDRPAYVLAVEPKRQRSLLYRGTIWVDAADYAVVRIEAEPAKNPSFWIRSTQIHHIYEKTGAFWLPQSNRSETKVRLGGTAILTIDYGDYRLSNTAAGQPVSATPGANAPLN
jgi:hypothetical protein